MPKGNSVSENSSVNSSQTEKPRLTVKIFDVIIDISLFMVFLGLPLFFTGLTFQGIAFEKQIYFYFWILLALVVWAVKGVVQGEMKIRRTSLDIPIILFLFVSILSTIFSIDRWHSFWGYFGDPSRGLTTIIAIIVTYYLLTSHFEIKKLKWFLGGLIFSNFISALWVFLVVMKVNFLPAKMFQFAPLNLMGSFSMMAIFLSCMLPLIVTAIFQILQNVKNQVAKLFLLFLLGATLLLDLFLILALYSFISLAGWVALLLGLAVFLIFVLSKIVKSGNSSWNWLPMAVFIIVIVFMMGGQSINVSRVALPQEINSNYLPFSMSLSIAKESLKNHFFLGSGPATYGYDFSLYHPQDFNVKSVYTLRFYQGTNIFFEMLSTVGIVGSLLLAILLISYISFEGYLLFKEKGNDKLYSLGFFSSSVIFLVSILTSRLESSMLFLGFLICILSLILIQKESNTQEKYWDLSLKASPKFALTFAFVFMVISASVIFIFIYLGKVYAADVYAGRANSSQPIGNDFLNKMEKAINLYKRESKYYVQVAQGYLILANNEALKEEKDRNIGIIQDYLNKAISLGNMAKNLSKNDVATTESLAQIYENSGLYVQDSFGLAEENYKRGLELEPHNPVFFLKLGQIKISQAAMKNSGNSASAKTDDSEKKQLIEDAENLFQKSIDEKANFDLGYFNLGLAEEALGNLDAAIQAVSQAYVLDKSNINYTFNLGRLYQQRGKGDDNKLAEILFKNALNINDKEINTHFYLGLLYEKNGDKNKAIDEYQKVADLLADNNQATKDKIQKMIENVKNGTSNISQNSGQTVDAGN
jgi:cytochrome c-type biogenesis protein CcmH/NrfG